MTIQRYIQDTLIRLIQGFTLSVDARTVTVIGDLPEQSFTNNMPLVSVNYPLITNREQFTGGLDRIDIDVPIVVIDRSGGTFAQHMGATDNVSNLIGQIIKNCRANLSFISLRVLSGITYEEQTEIENFGNGLVALPLTIRIPVYIEPGQTIGGN